LRRNPIRTRCRRVIHDLAPIPSLIAAEAGCGNIGFQVHFGAPSSAAAGPPFDAGWEEFGLNI
jgi:hypothetical protein